MKVKNNFENKLLILIYIAIFFVLETWFFIRHLDLNISSTPLMAKILFFDTYFIEFSIFIVIIILFLTKNIYSLVFTYCVIIVYLTMNITQMISIALSGEFLSKLAVDNIEFIDLLLTKENMYVILSIVSMHIVLPMILTYIYYKKLFTLTWLNKIVSIFFVILISISLLSQVSWMPLRIIEKRQRLLIHNSFENFQPIKSFFNIFLTPKEKNIVFDKHEIKDLTGWGYHFDPYSSYPLMKHTLYDDKNICKTNMKKLNVIVIFTEGFSAISSSIYNQYAFPKLTPHLKNFSDNNRTTIVSKYYNHTAATYRGLYGQLCSLYPWLGGSKSWIPNKVLNLSNNTHECIAHVFNHNGYDTTYLNMHYKNSSANDEMASHIGFQNVLSGEKLSQKYLGGIIKKRKAYLNDHQAYKVLEEFLKNKNSKNPFFLSMYTVETHAFVDIDDEGIPYKEGKDNVLNTISNMDDAFGRFWEYFQHSKYFDNTIILFTSDHAHYYGKEYINTMKKYNVSNYHNIFIDQVPLLIYTPDNRIPKKINVEQATSIDLAPTIANLAHLAHENNAFVGHSLFEKGRNKVGISAYGSNFFMIKENNMIFKKSNISKEDKNQFELIHKFIDYTHILEKNNAIYAPQKK